MWSVIYSELSAHHARREFLGEINDDQLEQELLKLQRLSLPELKVVFVTVTGKTPDTLTDYYGL